jgi:hypothetical protein
MQIIFSGETMKIDINYAISFGGGQITVKKDRGTALSCLTSELKPCVIIVPESYYKVIDSFVRDYAQTSGMPVTIGCIGYDTDKPMFLPAAMSVDTYRNLYMALENYINQKRCPPRETAANLLRNVSLIGRHEQNQFVLLNRYAKDYSKVDLYTKNSHQERVEIYVTQLERNENSYSVSKLYSLKLKALARFLGF